MDANQVYHASLKFYFAEAVFDRKLAFRAAYAYAKQRAAEYTEQYATRAA